MEPTSQVSDSFKQGNCGVCGCSDVNRYFGFRDRLIDYNGTYYSYREIIHESLDFFVRSIIVF